MTVQSLPTATAEPARRETDSRAGAGQFARVDRRYQRLAAFDQQQEQQALTCLSPREQQELTAWHDRTRRRAWLLARLLAKQLLAGHCGEGTDLTAVEVLSLNDRARGSRPRVYCHGVAANWSLSLSHTGRGALVALSTEPGVALGVDVADAAALSDAFVKLWFTPGEQAWLRDARSHEIACFIWAAKEAIYKALNAGESFAPRDIEVLPGGQCHYRQVPLQDLGLQSWSLDSQIAVIAAVRNASSSLR